MKFYVYITTNPNKDALYVGVTNNLEQRIIEHYINRGNTTTHAGKYFCYGLIFYEEYSYINNAIAREKEIKKWRREKKEELINSVNPEWKILNKELFGSWPLADEDLFHPKIYDGLTQTMQREIQMPLADFSPEAGFEMTRMCS